MISYNKKYDKTFQNKRNYYQTSIIYGNIYLLYANIYKYTKLNL